MTREARIGSALDLVRARCDVAARRAADPVDVVHRYADSSDQELVALLAACVAFGNVKAIRAKLDDALARLGPRPSRLAEDPRALKTQLRGWVHRVFRGDDIARLLAGARRVQLASGSLGARFRAELDASADEPIPVRGALAGLCAAIRREGKLGQHANGRRGPSHLLPDPRGASASKRLFLFLRWMVRPADGVDLGLWTHEGIATRVLLVPVDVHIHKLAGNLGWTKEKTLSWKAAEEITRALRRYDADDPVKYDFSLCHMGMLQRCPSKRDTLRCDGCGVKSVCLHWNA